MVQIFNLVLATENLYLLFLPLVLFVQHDKVKGFTGLLLTADSLFYMVLLKLYLFSVGCRVCQLLLS